MPKSVNPLLRRKSSSPFSTAQRTKPGARSSGPNGKGADAVRLADTGLVPMLVPTGVPQDVISLMRHIQAATFDEIPERAAGMDSVRISEVLRYRRALPPVVSLAHLHALSTSATETEREVARLIAQGRLRKVVIPGRGKGGSAVGEGVVLVADWTDRLRRETALEDEARERYVALMSAYPTLATGPVNNLTPAQLSSLVTAGFLTNPAALSSGTGNVFARPVESSSGTISKAGSAAATGTLAAVGGQGAVHDSGGGGSTLATQDNRPSRVRAPPTMTFSLPSTGAYLKLLTEARLHLLYLLRQLSPRYKEATRDLLEEKWNGNVLGDSISTAKRARGEWTGVLPGRTKRWREYYGLKFQWILEECVGSGLVELFDTGSVGVAVRAI